MTDKTAYLKINQISEVHEKSVFLKDVGEIYCDDRPTLNRLKALKIKTVLLTWNLTDVDATSPLLRDEAGQHWELSAITEENPQLKRMLLYKLREPAVSPLGDEF